MIAFDETAADIKRRDVTNRIIDVKERFLNFFMSSAIFETGSRQNRKDIKMKKNKIKEFVPGIMFTAAFAVWTALIQIIDVQPVGQNGTNIGFAAFNCRFHQLTGVHMAIYTITDWLGLVPIAVCMVFGGIGLVQWIRRRNLLKVDHDLMILGIYYMIVIFCYLIFEMIPINYRPVLIEGRLEASYPSSTTLLVLSVMPTFMFQAGRRFTNTPARKAAAVFTISFSVFMVIGRLISGVHWATDIFASVFLSAGLFLLYRSAVMLTDKAKKGAESTYGVQ